MIFIKLIIEILILLGIIGFISDIGKNEKKNFFVFSNYKEFRSNLLVRIFNRVAYVAIWSLGFIIISETNTNSFFIILQIIIYFFGVYACIHTSIKEHHKWLENEKLRKQNENSQNEFAEFWDNADEETRKNLVNKFINDSFNSMWTEEDTEKYAKSKGYRTIYINGKKFFIDENYYNECEEYNLNDDLDNYDYDEYLMEQADLGNTAAFALKAERDRERAERNL